MKQSLSFFLIALTTIFSVHLSATYFIKCEHLVSKSTTSEINLFYLTHTINDEVADLHRKKLKRELAIDKKNANPFYWIVEKPVKINDNLYSKGPANLFHEEDIIDTDYVQDVEVRGVAFCVLYMMQFSSFELNIIKVNSEKLIINNVVYTIKDLTFQNCIDEYESNLEQIESWASDNAKETLFSYELEELKNKFAAFENFLKVHCISFQKNIIDYLCFIKEQYAQHVIEEFYALMDGISCNFIQLFGYIKAKEINVSNNAAIVLGAYHCLHLSSLLQRDGYVLKKNYGSYSQESNALAIQKIKLMTQANTPYLVDCCPLL